MKINELLNEAPPGVPQAPTGIIGKGLSWLSNKKTDYDISRAVNNAYKFWLDHVKKMSYSGANMNDPTTYLNELSRWMRVRLHIPANSKILIDMISYLKTNGISDQNIINSMTSAVKSTLTSSERGMRYATRSSSDMNLLMKQVIPLITPLMTGLTNTQKQELFNFITAKVTSDISITDPKEIINLAQNYIKSTAGKTTSTKSKTSPIVSKNLVAGSKVNYAGKQYTWTNRAWRSGTEILRGSDAKAATAIFRKTP